MGKIFFHQYMANNDFSEPPRRAIPKIPFSFFCPFLVWFTSEARVSVSLGFWGFHHLRLSGEGGGSSQGALSTPPPLKAQLPKFLLLPGFQTWQKKTLFSLGFRT